MGDSEIHVRRKRNARLAFRFGLCLFAAFFIVACAELEKPKPEPFYAETAPPQKKEFRWSNGRMPRTFDPALAGASPETDVVRAIYEGLTDSDPKTLAAIPAIAEKWTSANGDRSWTFTLRRDAKWSNSEAVTAADFVRSWRRAIELGEKVPHRNLLSNIKGAQIVGSKPLVKPTPDGLLPDVNSPPVPLISDNSNTAPKSPVPPTEKSPVPKPSPTVAPEPFGAVAVDDRTLRVDLKEPDDDFPALLAHPVFRPVYGTPATDQMSAAVVTNGAFRVTSVGTDGVTLDRSEFFWAPEKVELERVRFIPAENAEKALEQYRRGEIDAITNVNFEPLALKLLEPYDDFRRQTHSALNFYEFNTTRKPFDDQRVREALAIAIERDRLTEIETGGATRPATTFLPFDDDRAPKIVEDKERAKKLLADAGYEDGEDFPVVRLIINRNDLQQRIARAVVRMWKQNLNLDVIIEVRENAELDFIRASGDFDLIRRGVVLPTTDERASLNAIFAPPAKIIESEATAPPANTTTVLPPLTGLKAPENEVAVTQTETSSIVSETEALETLPAIPLYFPTSYLLVKPYIDGFDINSLDAPSLKQVRIDTTWKPTKPTKGS